MHFSHSTEKMSCRRRCPPSSPYPKLNPPHPSSSSFEGNMVWALPNVVTDFVERAGEDGEQDQGKCGGSASVA